ncbi:MAG: glycosyltransferase [Oscillatoriaceae cyanobacterium Prado104]|jgi:glycosyltransferase involved in cell wall biosynthesis|nr:glycosyltransferase [Oscillatoriaceae cyanobacterium Prado104]
MFANNTLTILQPLQAKLLPNGKVLLTRKLIEAVVELSNYWDGSITVMMEETQTGNDNIDCKVFNLDELPFKLEVISFDRITPALLRQHQTALVLAVPGYRQNHITNICHLAGIPCIYVSEYTLKTRKQIASVNASNPLGRLRKIAWEQNQEIKQRVAIAGADGLQCNGTPTYKEYLNLNPNALLFFDTRISEDMLATPRDIEMRTANRSADMPLRLLFSGRLIKMKGADHLMNVAIELKKQAANFEMFISGAGDLEKMMHDTIANNQLQDCVKMLGVPDFKTEFFPFVKQNIDLFVCCHRQGDPSCTYVETMSCGVPIVGYANEAFEGISEISETGWVVPMDRPKLMAQQIIQLSYNREIIRAMSYKSLDFARQHTFEKTFKARTEHMQQVAENSIWARKAA